MEENLLTLLFDMGYTIEALDFGWCLRSPDNGDNGGGFRVNQSHRIHGAAIYGNMDPINIPPMLAYTIHGSYGNSIHHGLAYINIIYISHGLGPMTAKEFE